MIFTNKRSESEIIAQILDSANEGMKKTHLLYNTNISYSNFIKYFDFLIDKNFLEERNGNPVGKVYYTTQKGKQFLKDINIVLEQAK